jgi:hypothetical protein
MVHIDCFPTILARDTLHAPTCVPNDGLPYVGIHATQTQADRGAMAVPCGPRGAIRDYIGFYFGPRSPMLFRICTGHNVTKVDQSLIIYLESSAQAVAATNIGFVYADRHSLARVAAWRDALADLTIVDFDVAYATFWNNTPNQPDRQERKQAEFLVHQTMPWRLIHRIGVQNAAAEQRVRAILQAHANRHQPAVHAMPLWYY